MSGAPASLPPARIGGVDLRFYPDPETGEPHIYNHGVSEEEVQ